MSPVESLFTGGVQREKGDGAQDNDDVASSIVWQREGHETTELGNADRFVRAHSGVAKFVPAWGWTVWDGTRWNRGATALAYQLATDTVRDLLREAAAIKDSAHREQTAKWALKSQDVRRIEAMLRLARHDRLVTAPSDTFDRDPMLFNVANGTIDLHTGQLRGHCCEDFLTRLSPIQYDATATCPSWHAFLHYIMADNPNMLSYLWRLVGYILTGRTDEQCLFAFFGWGANGKTVFLETLKRLLGEYAKAADADSIMLKRSGGGIPNDIAALAGARLATISETAAGQRLDERRVKELTGGDTISARFLHREWFEFVPEFKLCIRTNHRPEIRGTDEGIWRRIHLIPFNVHIPQKERDPRLLDKLVAELPGILNWAIGGCREWQQRGLDPPVEVCAAVQEYREDMDEIGAFLTEQCVAASGARISASQLYSAYRCWCGSAELRPLSQRRFGETLTEKGFKRERSNAGKFYCEFTLRSQ